VFVRKLTLNLVAMTSVVSLVSLVVAVPDATGSTLASKPSINVLVPASAAKAAGFTEVVSAPAASSATSIAGCPDGAQEEFANASAKLGLESEVLYCSSAADATKLLKNIASSGKDLVSPKGLESNAVERAEPDSTYIVGWVHGNAFELTGLITALSASSTTSTTTPPTMKLDVNPLVRSEP